MQIIAEKISYTFPSGKSIIRDISFSLPKGEKAVLVGDNGSGKSTLMRILTGALQPNTGSVQIDSRHWLIPQHFGQYDDCTISQMLRVEHKIEALRKIENGSVDPIHFDTLADDWSILERLQSALEQWNLPELSPSTPLRSLSGGEKTRAFLAGIDIHQPRLVLMDEPTNHLDRSGRKRLYRMIRKSNLDFLIISHDRELLNLCSPIYELSSIGIKRYGGNYDFYEAQKQIEIEALEHQIHHSQQAISDAKQKHRETMERKQRMDARGNKKAKKEGLPKIAINTVKNRAENSTSRLNDIHGQKIAAEKEQLQELKKQQRELKNIRVTVSDSSLHAGKILFEADRINYTWPGAAPLWKQPLWRQPLWRQPLSFVIRSGERIRITGSNGSGKSTLIRLLNAELTPSSGQLNIQSGNRFLLDQEYALIDRKNTILEQAADSNQVKKPDHVLKTLLHRYLFEEKMWDQPCWSLSGGEMMRLSLCCLALHTDQPDTLILDEPTNNLDLRNIKLLTEAVSNYRGTLIVVSHDTRFAEEVGIEREIEVK